jgi:hypothetical protein
MPTEAILLLNETQPIDMLNDHNESILAKEFGTHVRLLLMAYHLSNRNLLSLS